MNELYASTLHLHGVECDIAEASYRTTRHGVAESLQRPWTQHDTQRWTISAKRLLLVDPPSASTILSRRNSRSSGVKPAARDDCSRRPGCLRHHWWPPRPWWPATHTAANTGEPILLPDAQKAQHATTLPGRIRVFGPSGPVRGRAQSLAACHASLRDGNSCVSAAMGKNTHVLPQCMLGPRRRDAGLTPVFSHTVFPARSAATW